MSINKIGHVGRKHGTVKRVLERIKADDTSTDINVIMVRATNFSNTFSGSSTLSPFKFAKRYAAEILVNSQLFVTTDILKTHDELIYERSMQRLIIADNANLTDSDQFITNMLVIFYYKSSTMNEPNECKEGKIDIAEERIICI